MTQFKKLCEELENEIKEAYEQGVTLDQAEKLAAKFLHAQLQVSKQLTEADLDSRMRKTGVKSIRAAIYMNAASKGDKKPTEAMLASIVDSDELVSGEQNSFDAAEANKNELERYYEIFLNAHVYFRGVAKGRFE